MTDTDLGAEKVRSTPLRRFSTWATPSPLGRTPLRICSKLSAADFAFKREELRPLPRPRR